MSEVNDILSQGGGRKLPEDKLMAYLEGKLSPEEQHEVEHWLSAEGMESDAIEGLKEMEPAETKLSVNRINHRLSTALHKNRKRRRKPGSEQFTWIAIVIILLLAVLAYIVIRKAM